MIQLQCDCYILVDWSKHTFKKFLLEDSFTICSNQ